jgi:DNA polymerase III alpha subunit
VIEWSREFGVPVIATNDAHYVKREDAIPHDLMLCIQTTSLFSDPKRISPLSLLLLLLLLLQRWSCVCPTRRA